MELSLATRDVIAMATAVGLSHGVYDAAICLGVCDKIVPGLVIGALSFGHLPVVFAPAGPMSTGIPNAKGRGPQNLCQRRQAGKIAEIRVAAITVREHVPFTAQQIQARC